MIHAKTMRRDPWRNHTDMLGDPNYNHGNTAWVHEADPWENHTAITKLIEHIHVKLFTNIVKKSTFSRLHA